jgi:PKD repeat protein
MESKTNSTRKNHRYTLSKLINISVLLLFATATAAYAQPDSCSAHAYFTIATTDYKNLTITDHSSGSNLTYLWGFGDGMTSTNPNPGTHTYSTVGAHSVYLQVTDVIKNCSSVFADTIYMPCSGNFSFTHNQHDFNFTSNSSMDPATTTYAWDFGDGSTSTLQNPSHHFADLVSSNVCLTVTSTLDPSCSDKQCAYVPINTNCFADFHSRPVLDYTYSFEALQNDCDYLWDFGDGTTSTLQSVRHIFPTHNSYNVCLTVTSKSGIICTNKHCDMIDVHNSKHCNAFFSIFPDSSTTDPNDFLIYNLSYGSNLTYLWEFGDGTTSTLVNPTHDYAGAGSYFICLEVRNDSAISKYCTPFYLTDTMHHLLPTKFHVTVIDKTITTGIKKNDLAKATLLNYPNPFNGSTTISYNISTSSAVELDVYNLLGVKVATIEGGTKASGNCTLEWNAQHLSEGIYLLQLKANDQLITKKIIIAK